MRCMIAVCKYLCSVVLSVMSIVGCSSLETKQDALDNIELEASWAEAYHNGVLSTSDNEVFGLVLVSGRTDENLSLISTGALASIILNAPKTSESFTPSLSDGIYIAAGSKQTYTFDLGEKSVKSNEIEGSRIGVKRADTEEMKLYPIEGGQITITSDSDGTRKVIAELKVEGRTVLITFCGELTTYDFELLQ